MTSLPQTIMTLPIKEMNTPCDFTQCLLKMPAKSILHGISAAR